MTGPVVSVGPFPLDKIVVQYRYFVSCLQNNSQTCGGLGRVCTTGMYCPTGHVLLPKFLLNGKQNMIAIHYAGKGETALLKVENDTRIVMQHVTLLVLLDLSAA